MLTSDFTDMQPIIPNEWSYDAYGKSLFNHLASSLGIPMNMMSSTNGTNYSSSMASMKAMMATLPKPSPPFLNGRLLVCRWLCDPPKFIRWKRKHRKARINKKWQKRYGAVYEYCKGVAWNACGNLHVCPCMANALKLAS